MMFFQKKYDFCGFRGVKGEMYMISGFTSVTKAQGEGAVMQLLLDE